MIASSITASAHNTLVLLPILAVVLLLFELLGVERKPANPSGLLVDRTLFLSHPRGIANLIQAIQSVLVDLADY